ncbi:MAG: hypothetical protein ACREHG_09240, partial [Candidatus Saccharimonadales bacterium]
VQTKLKETLGNNYPEVLKSRIQDLGLTEDFVNDLARKHPQVLFKTLGVDQPAPQQNFQAPPHTSVRSDNFAPKGGEKRTWSFYQKMKTDNPKRYYDAQTNVQMHNDFMSLGEEFKDGDYNKFGH